MKKILLLCLAVMAISLCSSAQTLQAPSYASNGAPTGNCPSTAWIDIDWTTGLWYYCPTAGSAFVLEGESVVARTSQKAETGTADASVLTVTPPATIGTYKVCVAASVSSATSGVIGFTLSWTDSNGNAQSNVAVSLTQWGTAAPATTFTVSAAGNYSACEMFDINNAAAAVIVKWVGGGTTAAKVSATISRLS
jgi:hypothetical protein